MDRDDERLMRETYARCHELRTAAQQLVEQAEELAVPWRNGPYSDTWSHLAQAVADWSSIPNRTRRWTDQMLAEGMPGMSEVERRNLYQAQLLADPQSGGQPTVGAVNQQQVVDAIDAQVEQASRPDGVFVSALIEAAHRTVSNPDPAESATARSELPGAGSPYTSTDRDIDL